MLFQSTSGDINLNVPGTINLLDNVNVTGNP